MMLDICYDNVSEVVEVENLFFSEGLIQSIPVMHKLVTRKRGACWPVIFPPFLTIISFLHLFSLFTSFSSMLLFVCFVIIILFIICLFIINTIILWWHVIFESIIFQLNLKIIILFIFSFISRSKVCYI